MRGIIRLTLPAAPDARSRFLLTGHLSLGRHHQIRTYRPTLPPFYTPDTPGLGTVEADQVFWKHTRRWGGGKEQA